MITDGAMKDIENGKPVTVLETFRFPDHNGLIVLAAGPEVWSHIVDALHRCSELNPERESYWVLRDQLVRLLGMVKT